MCACALFASAGVRSCAGPPSALRDVRCTRRGAGFYPGTGQAEEVGAGAGRGRTLNLPWPRGNLGDADYVAAFELARHEPVCFVLYLYGLSLLLQ